MKLPILPTRQIFIGLLAMAIIIGLAGCRGEEQAPPLPPKSIKLQIVHSPELGEYLNERRTAFLASSPALQDSSRIGLDLMSEPGYSAASKIASGDIKATAWLAPSTSLVNYTNVKLKNLGARQRDCVPLFSTPMIIAIQERHSQTLNPTGREFSWTEISQGKFLEAADSLQDTLPLAYSHGLPTNSQTGLDALIQLAYFAAQDREGTLSMDALTSSYGQKHLKDYEAQISSYSRSEKDLLERAATSGTKRVRFSLTTEQQVAAYNLNRPADVPPLVSLYPEEGSFWADYSLCTSDADWATPAHLAALKQFIEFLSNGDSQLAIKKLGFRPAVLQLPETAPLTPRYGVDPSLPKKSFLPVSGDIISHLTTHWSEIMRPLAVVLILDSSRSMEGQAFESTKTFFRSLLAKLDPKDLRALVSFASQPKIEVEFTTDPISILPALDSIQSIGGSAVYDGIRTGIQLMTSPQANQYRKTILIVTDGDDKNSESSLQGIIDSINDKFGRYDINLIIVGVKRGEVEFADLKRIARAANGLYRESSPERLSAIFEEVSKSI